MPSGAIYLDNHATTRLDRRVLDAMMPFFTGTFGNPASRSHAFGWEAEEAVEESRSRVADLIGARPEQIVFTSGATESNNLALFGTFQTGRGHHLVTVATEHPSVLETADWLETLGWEVTRLTVDRDGQVDPDDVTRALREDTALVSVMLANNEIGTLHHVTEIARVTRARGVALHTDAAQAVGHLPVDVESLGVDLLSISAHKFHGPKGVGALFVRGEDSSPAIAAVLHGGRHERGLRAGTVNVPGIVGLARACEISATEMTREVTRVAALRDRLHQLITDQLDAVSLNGHPTQRLPNNVNLSFHGIDGEALVRDLGDVAVSTGSACASASDEPSHVLLAIGLSRATARSSVRFSLGRFTTETEVETAASRVIRSVTRLRELSPYGASQPDAG